MTTAARTRTRRTLFGLGLYLIAGIAFAQPLKTQLESVLASQTVPFTGFETVSLNAGEAKASAADEKYLVLDFRFDHALPEQQLQASVHKICQVVLLDTQLIRTLSAEGYNRLAVAFDHESQYDCF